jgi:hypothetical protein
MQFVGQCLEPCDAQRPTRDGRTLSAWVIATALINDSGKVYAIATTVRICDAASINQQPTST